MVLPPLLRQQVDTHFKVLDGGDTAVLAELPDEVLAQAEVALTTGVIGIPPALVERLPKLRIACALGVGHENLPLDLLKSRGVATANGAGTNAACVADHAMALLLGALRAIPRQDRAVRAGMWRNSLPMYPDMTGRKLGIIGFGAIGRQLARRASAFDMAVGYHSRTKRDDVDYPWFDSALALATWADTLVVAVPGGADTHHMVNADVLTALGPTGVLVNVARGSVVDTAAVVDALKRDSLAGVALDVYETEPKPPESLFAFENVVLTPHVAGWSPQAMQASLVCFLDNVRRHYAGEPLRTPI